MNLPPLNPMAWHGALETYLILAAALFAIGIYGFMRRQTLVGMLISGEIILAAACLNIMAFSRFQAADPSHGHVFVLFIMGIAADEVAIGLSLIIAVYRNYRSIQTRELSDLKG